MEFKPLMKLSRIEKLIEDMRRPILNRLNISGDCGLGFRFLVVAWWGGF